MSRTYLDHAAATPTRPEVLEAMLPYFRENFGNPSAVYDLGSEAKEVMEAAGDKWPASSRPGPRTSSLRPPAPRPTTWPLRGQFWRTRRKGVMLLSRPFSTTLS